MLASQRCAGTAVPQARRLMLPVGIQGLPQRRLLNSPLSAIKQEEVPTLSEEQLDLGKEHRQPVSILNSMLHASPRTPWQAKEVQPGEQAKKHHKHQYRKDRWRSQKPTLRLAMSTPAGRQAGALARLLRTQPYCADITFYGIMSIYKCMKILALTNLFLDAHDSACSFVFAPTSNEAHRIRLQHMQAQQHRQRHQPAPPHDAADASQAGSNGHMQEPVPQVSALMFRLHAWTRPAHSPEVGSRHSAQMLDFALDLRQPWRDMAYMAFDTAFSIADNLYRQLISQLASSQPEQQPTEPEASPTYPCLVCGADMSQALVVFAAVSFVQQRLQEEHSSHKLVVTVLPHSMAPRVDGRKGFLVKLELQPDSHVRSMLTRHRIKRKTHPAKNARNPAPRPPATPASS